VDETRVDRWVGGSCGFRVERIRDMQNIEWAEDSCAKGLECETKG
jgi:hypothetical protein